MLELVASQRQRQFGLGKRDTLPGYCLQFDVRFAFNGGCPRERFVETPDGESGLSYLCAGYKRFFFHVDPVMCAMAGHLHGGREAREVMAAVRAADARRGRNDPCPCGGGETWKRCHGADRPPTDTTRAARRSARRSTMFTAGK